MDMKDDCEMFRTPEDIAAERDDVIDTPPEDSTGERDDVTDHVDVTNRRFMIVVALECAELIESKFNRKDWRQVIRMIEAMLDC